MPLKVIASPYREVTGPFLNYVKGLRSDNPRDVVCVYIPEYIVGHWWEQLLHNQTGLILKTRLNFMQGVMVTSVPYQLASSKYAIDRAQRNIAAAWRRPGHRARCAWVTVPETSHRSGVSIDITVGQVVEPASRSAPVAHGGHFVARHEGRVIFVRHAAHRRVGGRARHRGQQAVRPGDVVAVHRASPHRRHAALPDRGTLRRVRLPARRARPQPRAEASGGRRAAGPPGRLRASPARCRRCEPAPLGWRRRMRYHLDDDRTAGAARPPVRRDLVLLPEGGCRIADPGIAVPPADAGRPGGELLAVAGVPPLFVAPRPRAWRPSRSRSGEQTFQVAIDGFWQAHAAARWC